MVVRGGEKWACLRCIRGHRVSSCQHEDRELHHVAKKGRPVSQCTHCRHMRKGSRTSHVRCDCGEKLTKCEHLQQPLDGHNGTCCCNHGGPCSCTGRRKREHTLNLVGHALDSEHGQTLSLAATRCKWRAPASPTDSSTARKDDYSSRDSSSSPSPFNAHTPPSLCGSRKIPTESSSSSQSSQSSTRADSPMPRDGVHAGSAFAARGPCSDMPAMQDYHTMIAGGFSSASFPPSARCGPAHGTPYDCSFGPTDFFLAPPYSGLDDGDEGDYKPDFGDCHLYDTDGSPTDNCVGPGNYRTSMEPCVIQPISTSHDDPIYQSYMPRSDSVDALTPATPLTPSDSGIPLSLTPPIIGRDTDAAFWLPSSTVAAHCANGDVNDNSDMLATGRFWELNGSFNWATTHT